MSFVVNLNGKPQIYTHGYDLGTVGRTYAFGFEQTAIDVTAFADSARRRIIGAQMMTLRYDGLFDSTVQGAYTAIDDLRQNKRVISLWPDGATSSISGVAISRAFAQQYRPAGNMGEVLSLGFDIASDSTFFEVRAYEGKTSTSTAGASLIWISPSIDIGQTFTAGGVFFVHVFTASGSGGGNPQWVLRWQDAGNDVSGSFANVAETTTFNVLSGATTSTMMETTGSVMRWNRLRATLDANSGSITFMAGFGVRQ